MVEHQAAALDRVFGAIADPTRRAILQELGRSPARVTEIAANFPVSLNAISKHLMVLERAGLLRREVRGRDHVCSLEARPLRQAADWITETRAFWEVRLDAFERHVVEKRKKRQ
ncbi:MAG: metalloregulator ArsR/SmtB family transcription factor [Acidobacteriia bacterium]|nr:metalloregulator ArsR/SmtB family transcription factor [Terriglobia bacterium]